jgi:hypothetical protein
MVQSATISNNQIFEFLKKFKAETEKRFAKVEKAIEVNRLAIEVNRLAIEENRREIEKNRIAILENTKAIQENSKAIRENQMAILENRKAILEIQNTTNRLWMHKDSLKIKYSRQLLSVNAFLAIACAMLTSVFINFIS